MDLDKFDVRVFLDAENDKLYNSTASISINKQASRCLVLLISKSGTIVSKEDIVEVCWVKHGTFVSDVTVRQTFFNIRKALTQLDLPPDALTTVRGKGYMLAAGVIKVAGGDDVTKTSDVSFEETTSNEQVDTKIIPSSIRKNKWKKMLMLISIIILTLFSLWIFHISIRNTSGVRNIYQTQDVMGCKINMIGQSLDDIARQRDYIIRSLINKYGIKCSVSSQLYIKISDPVLYGYRSRIFISQCYEKNNNAYNSCKSNYEVDYDGGI